LQEELGELRASLVKLHGERALVTARQDSIIITAPADLFLPG